MEKVGVIKNCLMLIEMGIIVVEFFDQYFDDIMDYSFIVGIEKDFDEIVNGKCDWVLMLKEFY